MDLDIARIRFHYTIGRFTYDNARTILIGEQCVVNTEEGVEFGVVVGLKKMKNIDPSLIVEFDDEGRVIPNPNERHDSPDGKRKRVKNDLRKIYQVARKATASDIEHFTENEKLEKQAFNDCLDLIDEHQLDMKLVSAHYFFDRSKVLFEFIAEHRVDFRELVKDLASHFHARIELRQIGVRDEAKIVGGCGVCGRELCCNQMTGQFETISIKMAKEQNMPLNTSKISGLCSRLMCCLSHEYETYREIKKGLPHAGQRLTFNDTPAVIRDVNPLSRKALVETEDRRHIYVSVDDIKNENNRMVVTLESE